MIKNLPSVMIEPQASHEPRTPSLLTHVDHRSARFESSIGSPPLAPSLLPLEAASSASKGLIMEAIHPAVQRNHKEIIIHMDWISRENRTNNRFQTKVGKGVHSAV